MILFKCKMCGGDLQPSEGATTCECDYCGTLQTIPSADSEKKGNLFNRANRLRIAAEYDKAATVYAAITAEYPEEAEAYWGLCLCKFGIEYVEDPATAKKIPTCHRTRAESIMDDPDFEQACENADAIARRVYREEAKTIDRLQREILAVVANESPYDAFICYKETDEDGNRTEDSVLAQDIYDALTAKGLKVFFARITLEDKLGRQYEPYIYAALHSARVMLAVGTQYEYFDAVWVKNEWARFLDMMKADRTKALIPCFKGIDAYDMPREFRNLQAQDMGKLGWLQDLTRGVMKLCGKDGRKTAPAAPAQPAPQAANPTVDSLLRRAFVFLEDGQWESADSYADKVLDIDVAAGQAYLVKLMASLHARKPNDLQALCEPFDDNEHYRKIRRFGTPEQQAQVEQYLDAIKTRLAEEAIEAAATIPEIEAVLEKLQGEWACKSSEAIAEKCRERIEDIWTAEREIKAIKNDPTAGIDGQEAEKLKRISSDKNQATERKNRLQAELDGLQAELQNLSGFFTGDKRRELTRAIEEKRGLIAELSKRIGGLNEAEADAARSLEQRRAREISYRCGKCYLLYRMYREAFEAFWPIRGYRDVDSLLEFDDNLAAAARAAHLALFEVGNTVKFGHYEQDGNASNGADAIEWRVLSNDGRQALLISEKGFDAVPYNTRNTSVTWETCTLRKWLNDDFLNAAFTAEEQAQLATVKVTADRNPEYSTNPGNDTQDRVFLLSIDEVNRYFSSNGDRICYPTAHAKSQGAFTNDADACWWWLRSPGGNGNYAVNVDGDGSVSYFGYGVYVGSGVARPVVVLRLS